MFAGFVIFPDEMYFYGRLENVLFTFIIKRFFASIVSPFEAIKDDFGVAPDRYLQVQYHLCKILITVIFSGNYVKTNFLN